MAKNPLREIFVLDDDEDFANYLKLHLQEPSEEFEHFDVQTFADPHDFIRAIQDFSRSRRVVMAIIDYLLESATHGLAVAEKLGRDYPDIAQIVCTSHTNTQLFRKLFAVLACARGFVEKPISDGKEFRGAVETVLSQRDEFFSRFDFREEYSPFVIPCIPRPAHKWQRRKNDQKPSETTEDPNGSKKEHLDEGEVEEDPSSPGIP